MPGGLEPIDLSPREERGEERRSEAPEVVTEDRGLPPQPREIARLLKGPEPCHYLHDRPAKTELRVFTSIDDSAWTALLGSGFRRFGMVVFRPVCEGCSACIPIRIPVERFRFSRSQRRVVRKNRDVAVEVGPPRVDGERLDLHRAFHRERSARVGWEPQEITEEEYAGIFLNNIVGTLELCYRTGGRLIAVAYVDAGPEALNSIYCFHHPEHHRRSLGTFDILVEISIARRLGLRHLYLGYHIAACRSMAYKAAFRPAEVLVEGAWRELTDRGGDPRPRLPGAAQADEGRG